MEAVIYTISVGIKRIDALKIFCKYTQNKKITIQYTIRIECKPIFFLRFKKMR